MSHQTFRAQEDSFPCGRAVHLYGWQARPPADPSIANNRAVLALELLQTHATARAMELATIDVGAEDELSTLTPDRR